MLWRSIPSPVPSFNLKTTMMMSTSKRYYQSRMTLNDLRKRNAADKAADQCRGDVGISVDGLITTTIVDVAVGDATAPSYRQPPPVPSPLRTPLRPRMPQLPLSNRSTRPRKKKKGRQRNQQQVLLPPVSPDSHFLPFSTAIGRRRSIQQVPAIPGSRRSK